MALAFEEYMENVEALNGWDSFLIIGEAGRGKTNLAASAVHLPNVERVILVDIEGSAKGVGRLNPGVKVIKAYDLDTLDAVKDELLAKADELEDTVVIFDTLNAGQKLKEKDAKADPRNRNNTYAVWDELADWTLNWMRDFHNSPIRTIFISHAQDIKNDKTGAIKTIPKIKGSAKEDAPTVPDIVGYLDYEATPEGLERVLFVGEAEGIVTKNRFGLPAKIYNPTMTEIERLINESTK